MVRFTIAGHDLKLDRQTVEAALAGVLPEPLREHYVVVHGRRYPPKQVISCVTCLNRADFTTHQARRVLRRLGFAAARRAPGSSESPAPGPGPYGGRQAAALRPYVGKWVALCSPTEVLVAANTPQDVLHWLATHERRAEYGMFRVPAGVAKAEGAAPP